VFTLADDLAGAPAGLPTAAASILLTLADYETPVWLPEGYDETRRWLAFHSGAPVASSKSSARFALLDAASADPELGAFHLGDDRYPDTSATVIVLCEALSGGSPQTLRGPGIQTTTAFAPLGVHPSLWGEIAENNALFPLGVDLIFVAGSAIAGLPRTTQITGS
jgi:alpha-D-ribose 1-methylphosphonate 5-triphosphate synthase subunit PhnH